LFCASWEGKAVRELNSADLEEKKKKNKQKKKIQCFLEAARTKDKKAITKERGW